MSLVNHPADEGFYIITAIATMLGALKFFQDNLSLCISSTYTIKQLKYTVRIRRAFSDQIRLRGLVGPMFTKRD